ncbi:MAG: DUF2384 domain-containing protein [Ramlibacter sp.]
MNLANHSPQGFAGSPSQPFKLAELLMDEVDGKPILSPAKFIDLMNLDVNSFAQHAKVHRNTVNRAPAALSVQTHLRDNLRVLKAATDIAGGDIKRAIFWFQNEPLAPFAYQTAEALVAANRTDDVIRLLESYDAGFTG